MDSGYCPQCGTERTGSLRFCRKCGFDFDSPTGASTIRTDTPSATPAGASPRSRAGRQDLARRAIGSMNRRTVRGLFVSGGAVLGLIAGLWVMLNTEFSLRVLAPFVLPVVGLYLGQLLMITLWARR
jgi:hypothetical protein